MLPCIVGAAGGTWHHSYSLSDSRVDSAGWSSGFRGDKGDHSMNHTTPGHVIAGTYAVTFRTLYNQPL